jgi:hypothetical protein
MSISSRRAAIDRAACSSVANPTTALTTSTTRIATASTVSPTTNPTIRRRAAAPPARWRAGSTAAAPSRSRGPHRASLRPCTPRRRSTSWCDRPRSASTCSAASTSSTGSAWGRSEARGLLVAGRAGHGARSRRGAGSQGPGPSPPPDEHSPVDRSLRRREQLRERHRHLASAEPSTGTTIVTVRPASRAHRTRLTAVEVGVGRGQSPGALAPLVSVSLDSRCWRRTRSGARCRTVSTSRWSPWTSTWSPGWGRRPS